MTKVIVGLAIVLFSTMAWGWQDRYYSDRDYYDSQTAQEVRALREELQYQRALDEYKEEKAAYDAYYETRPPIEKFMSDHYFRGPKPPTR